MKARLSPEGVEAGSKGDMMSDSTLSLVDVGKCVCVCVRESVRERERVGERESGCEREGEREREM